MAITFSGVATQIDHSRWSKKPQETTSDGLLHFKWDIDMSPILTYHIHGFRCKQFDSKYLKDNICCNYLFYLSWGFTTVALSKHFWKHFGALIVLFWNGGLTALAPIIHPASSIYFAMWI